LTRNRRRGPLNEPGPAKGWLGGRTNDLGPSRRLEARERL
jgi:hypothetical protein